MREIKELLMNEPHAEAVRIATHDLIHEFEWLQKVINETHHPAP